MKVTPNTMQRLEGTISPTELAAFIRQTLEIPEGATLEFRAVAQEGEVSDDYPLEFKATWTGTKSAEQTVPARAYTTVKLP